MVVHLKFVKLLMEADIYPRFGPTMEWIHAHGLILKEAGGHILNLDNQKFHIIRKTY